MKVLVTGAAGFVGKNLIENLRALQDGRNATRPGLHIEEIYTFDKNSTPEELEKYCRACDFVFHLAGVSRPEEPKEFMTVNCGFTATLLSTLEKYGNKAPVLFAGSIQAALVGRFAASEYGKSKKAAEDLLFDYAARTGAPVYVYRFPNLAGKWIRPNYNSAVATFCHNIANDLPIVLSDPEIELELLFIDDLLEELLDALEGRPHRCTYPGAGESINGISYDGLTPRWCRDGKYCAAPVTQKATLGRIAELLHAFQEQPKTLFMPALAPESLEKKLYSMYLSYLPKEKIAFDLKQNRDARGGFAEILKTADHGQFSVNITAPGAARGQHWHNGKWELFIVVSGRGLIQERKIGTEDVIEFEVSGEELRAVHMLPGYTHSLINLSKSENLVTLMWANEVFDPSHPDTFFEPVVKDEGERNG